MEVRGHRVTFLPNESRIHIQMEYLLELSEDLGNLKDKEDPCVTRKDEGKKEKKGEKVR